MIYYNSIIVYKWRYKMSEATSMQSGNYLEYAKAATNILQGLGGLFSAGDVGRAKKKLLDTQVNYNKKQIQEALKKNYASMLAKYATERNNVVMQKLQADSDLRMQLVQQHNGAIDINESSFRGTAYGQLDKEFSEAMDQIRENNKNNMLSITTQAINQTMEQNIAQAKGHAQINMETEAQKAQAWKQISSGVFDATSKWMQAKADQEQQNQIANNINNMNAQAMSGSEYYKNKNSGWGSSVKQNQGGYLQLNNFRSDL